MLLDTAIELLQSDQPGKDESLSQCVMDELAKAHMWVAIFIAENMRVSPDNGGEKGMIYPLYSPLTLELFSHPLRQLTFTRADKQLAKALKHVRRGITQWSTLADSLILPSPSDSPSHSRSNEDVVAHNKAFFVDPAVSVRIMSIPRLSESESDVSKIEWERVVRRVSLSL